MYDTHFDIEPNTETFGITYDVDVWVKSEQDIHYIPPYKMVNADDALLSKFKFAGYMLGPVALLNGKKIEAKTYVDGPELKLPNNFYLYALIQKNDQLLIRGGSVE